MHIGGSALFDIVGEDVSFFDVPYKSLGNDGGSIKVCEFDEMTVMKGNGKLILHNVLVGRASDSLFEDNAYDMIKPKHIITVASELKKLSRAVTMPPVSTVTNIHSAKSLRNGIFLSACLPIASLAASGTTTRTEVHL